MNINTAQAINLNKADGTLMNNAEIKAYNEKLEDLTEIMEAVADYSSDIDNALYCYYYTENSELFYQVIAYYKEEYEDDHDYALFSEEEQKIFKAYINHEKYEGVTDKYDLDFTELVDENGKFFGVRSYFYKSIGYLSEDDAEDMEDAWKANYLSYSLVDEDELETWQWVLIGIAIGVGSLGIIAGITIPLVLHYRKQKHIESEAEEATPQPQRKKYKVDMDYDEDIDVYATDEPKEEETSVDESVEEVATPEEASEVIDNDEAEAPVEDEVVPETITETAEEQPVSEDVQENNSDPDEETQE